MQYGCNTYAGDVSGPYHGLTDGIALARSYHTPASNLMLRCGAPYIRLDANTLAVCSVNFPYRCGRADVVYTVEKPYTKSKLTPPFACRSRSRLSQKKKRNTSSLSGRVLRYLSGRRVVKSGLFVDQGGKSIILSFVLHRATDVRQL